MNCKFCGDVVDANDTVCQSCGRTIDAPELHYRNDKLEKNDDLKGYYKDRTAKKKTSIPKLVTLLLLIFAYPLGLIAIIFTDFKHVTKLVMLGFGVGVPLLFFLGVSNTFVETTSYSFDEAVEVEVEVEVVEINDEMVQVTFVTDESIDVTTVSKLFSDNTDIDFDNVDKALLLLEAVGVEEIQEIFYIGSNIYTIECDDYEVEIAIINNELFAIRYNGNELYNKDEGGFISNLSDYR
jgi:hypothetical protein